MLHLYDTMTRTKVPFEPRIEGQVSIYVCGPTVYDDAHLGHGRTSLTYDILSRYLRWSGYTVDLVSNFTDVDDKIIGRASAEGRSESEVAEEFIASYVEQMNRLSVIAPDECPRATEFIDGMIELITELIETGAAYIVEGKGVYFDVAAAPTYGQLAGRNLDQLLDDAGQRVEIDVSKRSPIDFALWKAAKPGEPAWDTPWGPGRPGWHTECVAMSMSILGEDFDIHGGGDDLVFPHHQNEEAQVVAIGKRFARVWMHSAMVNVAGDKMSKSEGNFTTLSDAMGNHDPRAIRLAVLQTHYRSTMELGDGPLQAAGEAVRRLDTFVRRAVRAGLDLGGRQDDDVVARFRDAMDDDMATPTAIDVIFGALRSANTALDDGRDADAAPLAAAVGALTQVLGLDVGSDEPTGDDDAEIDTLVASRTEARVGGDYNLADQIRDDLLQRGIKIEDTATGTIWHRV